VRIVVDTNVIVSALLSPGSVPGKVMEAWDSSNYSLMISEPLLAEYLLVLERPRLQTKHHKSSAEIHALIHRFRTEGRMVQTDRKLRVVRADPDDDIIVATAVAGNADFIVSGDRHLLEIGEHAGIRIIPPGVFLAILEHDL